MSARRSAVVIAAIAVAGAVAVPATAAPADPRLAAVRTFAFAIGDGGLDGDLARRYAGYDLVVVDGRLVTPAQVRLPRAGGRRVVLGYLSVGTIERWRPWYPAARRYALEPNPDWPGEWYADTAAPGYRRLIAERVAPAMLAKDLDGLFLDNVDMVREHPRRRAGMYALVHALRGVVDAGSRPRYLFAQNGEDVIAPVLPVLDGWNREDVATSYDFAARRYGPARPAERRAAVAALRAIGARGLLVTATDYTARASGAAVRGAVRTACAAGAIPFVSDIGLSRIPATPERCARG